MPAFLPGLELSRALYAEAVRPLLEHHFPTLRHCAARIGPGSEVQGFDTATSTDHHWGPRLQLFLAPNDIERHADAVTRALSERLPKHVRGWSTHFLAGTDPHDASDILAETDGPVNHRVEILDSAQWLHQRLGVDPTRDLTVGQWLSTPQQHLAEIVGGEVFHDDLDALTSVRKRLSWYPDQVWRYILACQWMKLSQEESFVGRAAQVDDDLGSAIVAARQARECMRLALLMSRRYAPYSKWLGTAFARHVPDVAPLSTSLRAALSATSHADRENHLCDAYENLARRHNALALTAPIDPTRRPFHNRPFPVIGADRFARTLRETLTDPALKSADYAGAVDQWADNTDFLGHHAAIGAAVKVSNPRSSGAGGSI